MKSNNGELLVAMAAYNVNILFSHWQAPTQTNEHKALGDLYESLADSLDSLAELCMGKAKFRNLPATTSVKLQPNKDYISLIEDGMDLVAAFRETCLFGPDDDVLNTLADMDHALNKAAYMLEV